MDYTQTTLFGPKDALASGDPAKLVKGTEFDAEFSAISAAIASKYDSGDIATNLEAAALTDDTVLITPAKLATALSNGTVDLNASSTIGGAGLVAEGRALTAGDGLTGGGTLAADRTFAVGAGTGIAVTANAVELSHLGLESLTDPGADRIAFWDDSAGSFTWLTLGTNLSITGTTLDAASGGGGTWGSITGTLSNQMDLFVELSDRVLYNGAGASIIPNGTDQYSLGSAGFRWLDLHVAEIQLSGVDATLTRLGPGQLGVENKAMLQHDGAYTSGKITFSTGTPTGGADGDIWFEYTP